MFEWFTGLFTGLSRRMNRGMVVCVGFVCVTLLAWAPASEGFLLIIAVFIILSLMLFLVLSYLNSGKSDPGRRNGMGEERHKERAKGARESSEN